MWVWDNYWNPQSYSILLVRKEPDQEDEPFFEVTHYIFHFYKTEVVKQKICQDNMCEKLYLQGSVRCISEKSVS